MKLLFPGDIIASEEEYVAGDNTYIDDLGNIKSSRIGLLEINKDAKEVKIIASNKKPQIKDIVYGFVSDVKDKVAIVKVEKIINQNNERKVDRFSTALIFLPNISNSYLDDIRDAIKIGDLVKGEIIEMKEDAYSLSLKSENLGVILAYCSKSKKEMKILFEDNKNKELKVLECKDTKIKEKRKVSNEYLGWFNEFWSYKK